MWTRNSKMLYRLGGGAILGILLAGCITQTPTIIAPSVTATIIPARPTVVSTATAIPTAPPASTSAPSSINVPAPFRCYLDGVAAKNLDATTACFADNALVIDVGRRIEGKEAIRRWLNNEVMGLKYKVESVTAKPGDAIIIVKISFSSGGGFRAKYDIDLDTLITKMDLQYA